MTLATLILADGVTIKLGDNVWSFGINFLVYLIIMAFPSSGRWSARSSWWPSGNS